MRIFPATKPTSSQFTSDTLFPCSFRESTLHLFNQPSKMGSFSIKCTSHKEPLERHPTVSVRSPVHPRSRSPHYWRIGQMTTQTRGSPTPPTQIYLRRSWMSAANHPTDRPPYEASREQKHMTLKSLSSSSSSPTSMKITITVAMMAKTICAS